MPPIIEQEAFGRLIRPSQPARYVFLSYYQVGVGELELFETGRCA
jgi:hypothetical protein